MCDKIFLHTRKSCVCLETTQLLLRLLILSHDVILLSHSFRTVCAFAFLRARVCVSAAVVVVVLPASVVVDFLFVCLFFVSWCGKVRHPRRHEIGRGVARVHRRPHPSSAKRP